MATSSNLPATVELATAAQIAGSDNAIIAEQLVNDVAQSLVFFDEDDAATRSLRITRAVEAVKALGPRDAMEAHLIVQMVCAHNIAVDATGRANLPGLALEARTAMLKLAARFMGLFQEQMRTLNKHRDRSYREEGARITAETVNIAAGGQAIVGSITTGGDRLLPGA